MTCRRGCSDCCGPVPWSPAEWARVERDLPAAAQVRDIGDGWRVAFNPLTRKCPFAGAAGCAVYDRRPFLCRLFGTARDPLLACPRDCGPERPLTAAAAARLAERYDAGAAKGQAALEAALDMMARGERR